MRGCMAKKRDISVSLLPLVFDSSINRVALIEAFYSQPVSHAKPDLSYAFELLKVNSSPSNSTRLIDLIHFFFIHPKETFWKHCQL